MGYLKKILQNKFTKIFGVLILGTVSFYIGRYAHIKDHNEFYKYPYIDFTRSFTDQEDFITNIQPLRNSLNAIIKEEGLEDSVSLYFEFLNTGANISINPQKKIFPASLTKLPLAIATAKKVESGVIGWDTIIVLEQNDLDQNSGYLYERGVGTKITVDELLSELLINSDNTAYKALLRNVEITYLTDMVSSLGLEDLFQNDGKMSAKEYTRFFRSLYTSSYLCREYSNKILDLMAKSHFGEYIKSGIPNNIKFSHKIGENYLYNSYSDAGIVYVKNRPYYIAIMYETQNQEKDKEKVTEFMGEASKIIYEYIENQ